MIKQISLSIFQQMTLLMKPMMILVSQRTSQYNSYKRPFSRCNDDIEKLASEIFIFIRDIISDSNTELNELLLNWIAYIVQYGKTGIAPVLMGKKGVGKGWFKTLLMNIISGDYCYVDECASRLGSRVNSYEEGKLLGVFEEVLNNNGDQHASNELMKKQDYRQGFPC